MTCKNTTFFYLDFSKIVTETNVRNQEIDRVRNFVQTLLNINGQFYIVGWRSVKWDFFFFLVRARVARFS